MIKLKLSVNYIVLLCLIIPTAISSRLKQHEIVGNAKIESTATILGSNPNQNQNKEDFRDEKNKSGNVKKQASKYTGVCWNNNTKKWNAQLKHNKKQYYGGLFKNEEHAAMKVNSLCDRLGIEHKNPMINIEADKIQQVRNQTSIYTGVCWNLRDKKWKADLMHKRKKYFGGVFDKEEHAAMSINLLCDKFKVERKNPMINIKLFEAYEQHTQTSKYAGVSWCKNRKRWKAQLIYKKKQYYGGFFHFEEDAAMSTNLLCDKYKVKRKNPMIDMKLFEDQQVQVKTETKQEKEEQKQNKKSQLSTTIIKKKQGVKTEYDQTVEQTLRNSTSQYTCVSWDKNNKKWRALLIHKGKKYFAGLFDNEKHAAMSVNWLCDKFRIQRKNLTIDIEFDAIEQKTKSKKYRSKAENIGNEKEVQVEEENILSGLKDQCEKNFMKRPYKKRKRNEHSIVNDVIKKEMVNTNHDGNEVFEEIQKDYIKILN